jgi:glycosyltransferase involved in cell wall biosynthesis
MLVGVCMLVYNHEKFVEQAVNSILSQKTSFDFKLFIGEDFSNDKSREILIRLKNQEPEKIVLLLNDSNIGMIENFNRTIDAIKAKYIAFCDGDDFWNSNEKLQQQVNILEANNNIGLVFSNLSIKEKNRTVKIGLKTNPGLDTQPEMLLVENAIATSTVMCRRILLNEAQRFLGNHNFAMGDYPLWLYVAQKLKLAYINQPLATYRIVSGSATNQDFEKQLKFLESQKAVKDEFISRFSYSDDILKTAQVKFLKKKMLLCFLLNKQNELKAICSQIYSLTGTLSLREKIYCLAGRYNLISLPIKIFHKVILFLRRS